MRPEAETARSGQPIQGKDLAKGTITSRELASKSVTNAKLSKSLRNQPRSVTATRWMYRWSVVPAPRDARTLSTPTIQQLPTRDTWRSTRGYCRRSEQDMGIQA